MKNKKFVYTVIILFIVIGITGAIAWNNRIVSVLTIDINPSIEISLDRNNKVKKVKALNKEAKLIIDNLENQKLGEAINRISENLIDKGFIDDMEVSILLYSNGKIKNNTVVDYLKKSFEMKNIHPEIITIKEITKEDEELAKKYNISPAKVVYLKSITKDNKNISIEKYKDKPIKELKETKDTGRYCEEGYTLEGDWCYKEISRTKTEIGKICPDKYNEYNGICYKSVGMQDGKNYKCEDNSTLENKKCIRIETYDAEGKCEQGEYRIGEGCQYKKYIGDAVEYCRITPEEDYLYNGRCLARKPTINGGCLGSDTVIDGYCYDLSPTSGYQSDWLCPNGELLSNPDGTLRDAEKKCYELVQTEPTSYSCNKGDKLVGTKCESRIVEDARKERVCPNGYTLIEDRMCIDLTKTADKIDGDVCNGDTTRLKNNVCITYEIVESKHN